MNWIGESRIAFLKRFSLLGLPNKSLHFLSTLWHLYKLFCQRGFAFDYWNLRNGEKKWIAVSLPLPQLHIGSIDSWKLLPEFMFF